jgi:hypothetical protein
MVMSSGKEFAEERLNTLVQHVTNGFKLIVEQNSIPSFAYICLVSPFDLLVRWNTFIRLLHIEDPFGILFIYHIVLT